jgi:hypothetical protein
MGRRPAASMGRRPAASMGRRPAASMGRRPAANMGRRPAASMGRRPAANMKIAAVFQHESTRHSPSSQACRTRSSRTQQDGGILLQAQEED